jgi:UDP-2-acetamido-3-amino-2,3-dideoxy-glucuronate N-acetyltransferase
VNIQNNISVYAGVTIGNGVFVGPHVCFTNDKNPRAVLPDGSPRGAADWVIARTLVNDGVSIGANATIVAGIELGEWCMIGAGAVVTKSVPPHALVLGNPGRLCGIVSRNGDILSRVYKPGTYEAHDGTAVTVA